MENITTAWSHRRKDMKKHIYNSLFAGNTLSYFVITALIGLISYAGIVNASVLTADNHTPVVQYDDDDMVPPMPDVPQAPEPGDIDDPALSPDSVITEPDAPIDQTEPYIVEPEPEVVDEPVINQDVNVINEPEAGDSEAVGDEPGPAIVEPEAVVNEPDPVVDQGSPIIDDE
jgi:hypothetical protein